MIQHIISEIKKVSTVKLKNEAQKLDAIRVLEKLLNVIDFSSEVVPIDDYEKLKNLFHQLKGSNLTSEELEILNEIVLLHQKNNLKINTYFEKGTKVIFGDDINATVIEELNNGLVKVNLEGFGEMKVLKKGLEPVSEHV